jgi:hypothetical protein
MATKKATGTKEKKVVLTLPDMGLKTAEINALKKRMKNEFVTSMGGTEALAARRIIIVVVVVIVSGEW